MSTMDLDRLKAELEDELLEVVDVARNGSYIEVTLKRCNMLCVDPKYYADDKGFERLRREARGLQKAISLDCAMPCLPGYKRQVCFVNRDKGIVGVGASYETREEFQLANPENIVRFEVGQDEGELQWYLAWEERQRVKALEAARRAL